MKLDYLPEAAQQQVAELGPYACQTVHNAVRFAIKLHADGVHIEHLLVALLEDEGSAAGQVVLHAFADPDTILSEVVAMCPGSLVIGSKRSLPFSVKGVLAMEASRAVARDEGRSSIGPRHLLLAAADQLPSELAPMLVAGGFDRHSDQGPTGEEGIPDEGPLLKFFGAEARRALSAACHVAVSLGRDAISPAHLMMGALEGQPSGLAGLSATRLQMLLTGQDEDMTPLPSRKPPFSESLFALLRDLPKGASTAPMLAWIVKNANPELRALLERQRVTMPLLERVGAAFRDPDPLHD